MANRKNANILASVVNKIGIWLHLIIFFCGRCLAEAFLNLVYALSCKSCPIRRRAHLPESLHGKTVVITGANGGIGAQLARTCAQLGATVILACRDALLARETMEKILRKDSTVQSHQLIYVSLDLASLASVRRCAQQINRLVAKIDVLFNNAGVMMVPKWKTEDGLEYHFGVNYLGHFLLSVLLMEKLSAAGAARIVNFSSIALWVGGWHYFDDLNIDACLAYNSLVAYGRSKQFVMLATGEMTRRLAARQSKVTVYGVHPGVVNTNLTRHLSALLRALIWPLRPLFTISPLMGAQTGLFAAFSEQAKPGFYHANCKTAKAPAETSNENVAKQLWELSCKLCDIPENVL